MPIGKKIDSSKKRKKIDNKLSTSLKKEKEKVTPRKKDRKTICIETMMKRNCKGVVDIINKFENSGATVKLNEKEINTKENTYVNKESQLSKFELKSQLGKKLSKEFDSQTKDENALKYGAEKKVRGLKERKTVKEIRLKDTQLKESNNDKEMDEATNSNQE